MAHAWTKATLYQEVNYIRNQITNYQYPFDARALIDRFCKKPIIVEMDLTSPKICGMLIRGKYSTTIAVNAQHTPVQKNFYLAHEVFHYVWHEDARDTVRFCKDGIERNDIAEWQANEAAAEITMPYALFIPMFVNACRNSRFYGSAAITDAKNQMESYFGVTARMVYMRLETLKYEVSQFTKGVSVDGLEVLSQRQQNARGIKVDSYNDIESNMEIQEIFSQQYSGYLKYKGWG